MLYLLKCIVKMYNHRSLDCPVAVTDGCIGKSKSDIEILVLTKSVSQGLRILVPLLSVTGEDLCRH